VGGLRLVADDTGLRQLVFLDGPRPASNPTGRQQGREALRDVIEQLEAYFAGRLTEFKLRLAPEGTPFQLAVWEKLREIPFGRTWSYGQLAAAIGRPGAARAVGLANGANPIPIIIPCHRVIGANGKLTGYGGGLPIKEKLLALERDQTPLR
jgi:methylated-DNA-[protein]-cysteine S-methyltransferase